MSDLITDVCKECGHTRKQHAESVATPTTQPTMSCDDMEDLLIPFAGKPSQWCVQFWKLFESDQYTSYVPGMVSLYNKHCQVKFDEPIAVELRREVAQLQKLNATIAEALRLSTELHTKDLEQLKKYKEKYDRNN